MLEEPLASRRSRSRLRILRPARAADRDAPGAGGRRIAPDRDRVPRRSPRRRVRRTSRPPARGRAPPERRRVDGRSLSARADGGRGGRSRRGPRSDRDRVREAAVIAAAVVEGRRRAARRERRLRPCPSAYPASALRRVAGGYQLDQVVGRDRRAGVGLLLGEHTAASGTTSAGSTPGRARRRTGRRRRRARRRWRRGEGRRRASGGSWTVPKGSIRPTGPADLARIGARPVPAGIPI